MMQKTVAPSTGRASVMPTRTVQLLSVTFTRTGGLCSRGRQHTITLPLQGLTNYFNTRIILQKLATIQINKVLSSKLNYAQDIFPICILISCNMYTTMNMQINTSSDG